MIWIFYICPVKPKNSWSIYFLSLILLVGGCKGKFCRERDENKGIIVSSVAPSFHPVTCGMPEGIKDGLVVRDDSTYQALFPDPCERAEIDFSKHTLLGLRADGGCAPSFIREVKKNESQKKYYYTVKVKNCGNCKEATSADNLVLVPRLPDGWTVGFDVK